MTVQEAIAKAQGTGGPTVAGPQVSQQPMSVAQAIAKAKSAPPPISPSASKPNRFLPNNIADTNPAKAKAARQSLPGVLPAIGAIAGGGIGAALGIPGGPAGIYAGGVAGTALGGATGDLAKQGIQDAMGQKKGISAGEALGTGAEYGALEAVGGPVASAGSKILKGAGETIYDFAVPTSAKEASLLQNYKANVPFGARIKSVLTGKDTKAPLTAAKTAFTKGLWGTESMIGVQAKRASNSLWKDLIGPQLEKSTTQTHMPTFFDELGKEIVASTPERSRQSDLLGALDALKEDYAGVEKASMKELQQFKEGWAKRVPEKAYKGKPIAGAFNDVLNLASSKARSTIYSALGKNVKQAYFDYGNLKGIQELGQKAMTGGKLKGGFGGFWSAIKDMAVTPVTTIGGQTLYKVGQGIEMVGGNGARVLQDIFASPIVDATTSSSPSQPRQPTQ